MKNNKKVKFNHQPFHINYKDPLAKYKLSDAIISMLPKSHSDIVIMCIGTDRSTGDALGPLVGSLFTMASPKILKVYGTLHKPIHAVNLNAYLNYIKNQHENPFIIAVDASLGKKNSIGSLITDLGPIKPGAAVNKRLPAVGDMHIIAVVNIYNVMNHSVLQSTRLSLIYDMATVLTKTLTHVDQLLSQSEQKYQKLK